MTKTHALVEDGTVTSTVLPKYGALSDGQMVSNFDKLDDETLKSVGWLPIVSDDVPIYDESNQRIVGEHVVENDVVRLVYSIENLPITPIGPPSEPSLEEQIKSLMDLLILKGIIDDEEAEKIKVKNPNKPNL